MDDRMNNKKNAFMRANSICPTPESVLLELVLNNDRENIVRLVETNRNLLNYIYFPEYNKPILLIACSEDNVDPQTVKTLMHLGASPYFSSTLDDDWQAIHFAACRTRSDILKTIIDNLRNPSDINATANGSNALHVLIKHGRSDLTEEFVKCAKLLIQQGINVNLGDSNGVSPILWAAKRGYKHIIKVILENSPVPVDLDTHQSRKKTARDIILSENLYDGPLTEASDNNNQPDENVLFGYLVKDNENAFVNFRNGDIHNLVNATNNHSTLLQTSCDRNLSRAVEHLIKSGADPNLTTKSNRQTPVEIAAEKGCYEIFQILLDHRDICIPKSVLINLLKCVDNEEFIIVGISHAKCYDILLKKIRDNQNLFDINETDHSHNSPLHYAIRYAEPEKVEELLELGASLGSKNKFGVMPIQDIEPRVLEKHLNNCVSFAPQTKKIDKEDFLVTFKYRTLIPPPKKSEFNVMYDNSDPESKMNNTNGHKLVAETEVIAYMSKTAEFKHLLKHPVIVSFLFLKWHKISWLFYTNLAFYVTFFCSLVLYIFSSYANFDAAQTSSFNKILAYTSWTILWVTFIMLVFRELFQVAVSPDKYLKNFENYIEIVLILVAGSILCNLNVSSDDINANNDTKKILSAVSILLAAFELVLMVGHYPDFSTNVVMLRTVSFNFFKFLMWYSLLIVAFALSFYILFADTTTEAKNETAINENSPNGEDDLFADPGKSVFKTIVMLTGEFDASSLNFQHFPVTGKIIFSLFIFMIAIILLNLLNGLAVSDTQMIKNNAELVGHITRAQHICYVESMFLGNLLPSKFIKALNNLCCCFPVKGSYTLSLFKPLAKSVCLFPDFPKYELTVFPNKNGKICLPTEDKKNYNSLKHCYCCRHLYLGKDTAKRTNLIVQEKRENVKHDDNFKKIENIICSVLEKNANSEIGIFMLNKKLDSLLKHLNQENNA